VGNSVRIGQKSGGLTTDLRDFFGRFFGSQGEVAPLSGVAETESRGDGRGTGFLIGTKGEILTNHHVVEGAKRIRVRLYKGEWLDARLIGADPYTDLALLEINSKGPWFGAPLGDSLKTRVGEWVLAIGNPFGLEETVTAGILSAKGRTLEGSEFSAFLQTDAPIHRGNSGGPLLNISGEVIGVNTAVVAGAAGIGFAIPINLVRRLLPNLRRFGRVRRGWIGVSIQDIGPKLGRYFKISGSGGVLVTHVQGQGPAGKAGVRPGDIIVSMEGVKLKDTQGFGRVLERAQIGTPTKLELLRGGKILRVKAMVRELQELSHVPGIRGNSSKLLYPPLGMLLKPLTPLLASRMGIDDPAGLLVEKAELEGPADRAGIRQGDIVRSINMQAVRSKRGVQDVLYTLKENQILFLIQREDRRFFLLLRRRANQGSSQK
jgi:serine protease Do